MDDRRSFGAGAASFTPRFEPGARVNVSRAGAPYEMGTVLEVNSPGRLLRLHLDVGGEAWVAWSSVQLLSAPPEAFSAQAAPSTQLPPTQLPSTSSTGITQSMPLTPAGPTNEPLPATTPTSKAEAVESPFVPEAPRDALTSMPASESLPTSPAVPTSSAPSDWRAGFADDAVRGLFERLDQHGSITEPEATAILGSVSALRQFSSDFQNHAQKVPFSVRIERNADGNRYVKEIDKGRLTTMPDLEPAARALVDLYHREVRVFLDEHKSAALDGLDQAAVLLETALARDPRVDVGFLGESQVGKSSLINAVLGQKALPTGGVGPLTAQATRITYAQANQIEVTYHPRNRLNHLIFALERYLERRHELPKSTGPTTLDADALALAQDVEATARDDNPAAVSEMGEYMLSQARLMLFGKGGPGEEPSRITLLDGVRASLGLLPRGPAANLEPLRPRIAEIQQKLGTRVPFSEADIGKKEFKAQLLLHAAGWASPLVSSLQLGLDSPMLNQMILVDLPGVGVLGDPAARVAEEFVKAEADAIVIVMPNNGLTETVTNVLERTNVITRLLFGARDGVPPIHVSVVVTQLDKVAKSRWEEQKDLLGEDDPPPDRHAIFAGLSSEMCRQVRRNIAEALHRSPDFEGLPEETRVRREATIQQLCEKMEVVCLAAPDYLSLATGNDETAFLKRQDATGVPEFKASLLRLRDDAIKRRDVGVREATTHLQAMLFDQLDAIRQRYEGDRGEGGTDWDRFREQLLVAAQPLREQMQGSHGELMGVLRQVIPERLGRLCDKAEKVGGLRLRKLQQHARSLRYQSLKAALTRNGTWQKQGIDYTDVLARAVVDVIAADWDEVVVGQVRRTVQQIVERDLVLVERLCEAARQHDDRIVADAQIDAQKRILQQEAQTCISWTQDHLNQLRENVATRLKSAVEKPIETACRKAAAAGDAVGTGAKERILEAFDDGGRAALAQAGKVAEKTLRGHYDGLLQELMRGYLTRQHDPLQATLEALTHDEIVRARRTDMQHRKHVIADVSALRGRLTETAVK